MTDNKGQIRDPARVRSAVAYNTGFRLLSQVAGAGGYILLVRLLSEQDFGYYQLFHTVPSIIATLFSMGIANTLLRYLPEYLQNREYGLARQLVTWCLRLRLVVTLLVLISIYSFWDQLAPIFKITDLRHYFILFGAIVITMFQTRILATSLSAYLLQKWSVGFAAVFGLVRLVGYTTALKSGLTLTSAFVIDLIANIIFYLGVRFAYNRYIPRPESGEKRQFSSPERKRMLRYAAFYNFNDVGSLAMMARADFLFIAAFMSPLAVGVYAFCTNLDNIVKKALPMGFFFGVVQPIMFTLDYRTQKAKAREYFQFLVKITFLTQIPIFVFIAAAPEALVSVLFGGKFIEYGYVLISVFAFSTLTAAQEPIFLVAQLEEKAGIVMASKIFSIYNIAANVVLIPIYGVMGAVVATGTAILFKNLFVWYFVRDIASFRGLGKFFLLQSIQWTICWLVIQRASDGLTHLPSFLLAATLIFVFALFAPRLADFRDFERQLISKMAGVRFNRVFKLLGLA